jgi:hypothetical protein
MGSPERIGDKPREVMEGWMGWWTRERERKRKEKEKCCFQDLRVKEYLGKYKYKYK